MMPRRGSAAILIVVLAVVAGGYYAMQAGYLSTESGGSTDTLPAVSVYWKDGGAPPSCVTSDEGVSVTAVARDDERRFDTAGTFILQWKSSSGWEDMARAPTDCASQSGDFFCTVSAGYRVAEESTVDGKMRVRAQLTLPNGTDTTPVAATRLATDGSC